MLAPRRASVASAPVASAPASTLVPYDTGWIALTDGIEVQLSPGASLRLAHRRLLGMRHLLLEGTARFRLPDIDSAVVSMRAPSLVVETPEGFVIASESEFGVTTRADTTDVHVYTLGRPGNPRREVITLSAVIKIEALGQILVLLEPGGARLVRGHDPVRLTSSR